MLVREISMKQLQGLWGLKNRLIIILSLSLFMLQIACQLYFLLYVVDGPLWSWYEDCSYAFDLVCYYFTNRMFASLKSCCILVYIWFRTILEFTRKTYLGMGKKIAEETLIIGRKFSLHPKGPCAKHSSIAKTLL